MFENTYSDSASVQVRRFMTRRPIIFPKGLGSRNENVLFAVLDPIIIFIVGGNYMKNKNKKNAISVNGCQNRQSRFPTPNISPLDPTLDQLS